MDFKFTIFTEERNEAGELEHETYHTSFNQYQLTKIMEEHFRKKVPIKESAKIIHVSLESIKFS